ncbi:putative disease resistance RPP13-like protein 1 [Glycine soja]|uniref:Putative disease resistance RPP13-like protein 1 n=2 Tax=Glycine soja TaxID=3848 RepID=A0A445GXB0_GLYSO|nr:putative disease resistance RPP13-like protein 1 [Glycine soja]
MALECVGGAFLSSFLGAVFQKLTSPQVLDFFRGTKINQKLRKDLENKLISIQAVLDDAEQKQFGNMQVRDWLIKLKVAMLDVEDVLDEIQHSRLQVQPQFESQTGSGCTCKVPKFFKSSSFSSINKEINSSMKKVLDDLDDLASRMDNLGLKKAADLVAGSGSGSKVPQSTSSVVESDICGRDGDKEMIINWLTSDTDNMLSILSIVGMGGLGKTTLAQLVYNDPRIEGKFIVKAWVCVSQEFDVLNVSRAILDTFTKSTENSDRLEIVHTKLKDKLRGNRFLLVLDDVWNESRPKWEAVQNALVCGAQGSRILVTTRSEEVASTMRSKEHRLGQLQEDYCWKLFTKHAFRDDNLPRDPVCPEIGMKIVKKCKGLPLALKSMGSLLHNKPFAWEWESVLQSEIWALKDSDIVPALALSYHHLPPHLKTCFAYCALFPKDYMFDRECLIQLWMAENFLNCHQCSTSPEEVGQQYFNDLLSRSFFQQSSEYKEGFVMHDLLNDLAKYVCGNIYFRLGVDQAKGTQKTTRHFSVSIITEPYFDEFGTSCDTKKLRTFMPTWWRMNEYHYSWNCNMSIHELFSKFKFLRVLSLSHCSNIYELPDSVCNLKHLRSLDLSHTRIKKLPDSTCSLSNLQILKLNYCRYLKELPSNLHELTNLHRLEFVNTEIIKVPRHMGKLKNLQVLMSSFDVGKSSEFTIQQLGELNLHGRLSFWELQNIENPSDALAADLKNKTCLVELEFGWNSHRNPDDFAKERDVIVIENLQPSKHLEKLSIRNYGGKQFPNWLSVNSLSNVVSLELDNCQSCQHLPSLGLFPFLKKLEISSLDGIVSIGADFHGNSTSSFPSLETLKFSSMKAWEKWECEALIGAFPCLQYLTISKCPKLKGDLPEQLLPLKELEISECKQLEASAPRALELDLEDFGKLQLDWASLKELRMGGHSMEASLLEKSDTLKELEIYGCPKYGMFCDCEMSDDGCDSLKTFPLDFFPALRTLDLRGFRNLQMITQDHTHNHLEFLTIKECPQLESLPGSMHMLLPSLKELRIYDCPRVESFPEGGLPSNLKQMRLYKCSSGLMASLKGALGGNPSLENLEIGKLDAESCPDEGLLPLSLTCLRIRDFPNLKKLDYKGLSQLSSLKKLILGNCPNLQQLPEEGLPKSISHLMISGCPNLNQRCQNPGGEDWPKIAHTPTVDIW